MLFRSITLLAATPGVATRYYDVITTFLTFTFLSQASSSRDVRLLSIAVLIPLQYYLSLYWLAGFLSFMQYVVAILALSASVLAPSFIAYKRGLNATAFFGIGHALAGPLVVLPVAHLQWAVPAMMGVLTAWLYVNYRDGTWHAEKYVLVARARGLEVYDIDFVFYTAATFAVATAIERLGAVAPLAATLAASAALYAGILATAWINAKRGSPLKASIIPQTALTLITTALWLL